MKNALQGQTNEAFYQAKILLDSWQANAAGVRASSLDEVFSQSLALQLEQCYRAILAEYAGLYNLPAPVSARELIPPLQQRALPVLLAERFVELEEFGLLKQIRQQLDARLSNTYAKDSLLSPVEKNQDPVCYQAWYQDLLQTLEQLREYSREE